MDYEESLKAKIPEPGISKLLKNCRKFAKKIVPVYQILKWKWHDGFIPNEQQIYENILYLINDIPFNDGREHTHATGGIVVNLCRSEMKDVKWFEIRMEISDYDSGYAQWPVDNEITEFFSEQTYIYKKKGRCIRLGD